MDGDGLEWQVWRDAETYRELHPCAERIATAAMWCLLPPFWIYVTVETVAKGVLDHYRKD